MPPKTNEELIASTVLAIINTDLIDTDVNAWEQLVENQIRTLLTEKDKEREEAVAEAYNKGIQSLYNALEAHALMAPSPDTPKE